ncbi:hypothetical protein NLJ89_g5561 [Agrocybe chaxingu]|uniref:Uncharacterized protein n=1 Tax=Agrocybe chaxingu TaxID=84603 RepID=A0A9W8K0V2_9AGAR|nr:hypothetical protein NLJ89_g5561 [Agrocybe chaxingu]
MSLPLVWFITGASSGLGRQLALEALSRGDKVVASARATSVAKLADLKEKGADALELDATLPLEKLQEVAKKAAAVHGRIDVLVNTAGYILIGPMEETTPEETLKQFNANVFGALNVTRAVLPYMREKKAGTIIFAGSICGLESTPFAGIYAATKWALRGVSQSLHDEISPLGLRSLCIDFGYFRTAILQNGRLVTHESALADYQDRFEQGKQFVQSYSGHQPGDPAKGAKVVVDVIKGEGVAAGKAFPRSLVLGTDCYNAAKKEVEGERERLEEWKGVSLSTDFTN